MKTNTPFLPVSLIGLFFLCTGCASLTPPKVSLPKAPAMKLPEFPQLSKAGLNPFKSKPKVNPSSVAQPPATPERSFQLTRNRNPLAKGPGLSSMIPGVVPNADKAQADFARAQKLYRQAQTAEGEMRSKHFSQAAPAFARAGDRYPDPSLKEDALFLAAESYFFADEYPEAVEAFGGLIKEFPNTRYMDTVDKRRFSVAQYWINVEKQDSKYDILPNVADSRRPAVDTFGNAVKLYDRIRYDNPNGKLADDATMAAAVAHFERGRFGEANELFDDLRTNFPSSEHQFQTHLLGLKAKMKIYAGPDYDGTVLDEAEDIVRRMQVAFPQESKQEEEYLAGALKEIRLKKAAREFTVAKYYDNRNEYGAAQVYYDKVRQDYKDTNLALESEKRLAQIENYPKVPEQTMEWLADAFPREDNPKPLLARDPPAPLTR